MKNFLDPQEAAEFASKWLPSWSGNNPELLISFYSEDAFYLDPVVPKGLRGKEAIFQYFKKLLAKNPDWTWTQTGSIPMEGGFLNKWTAQVRKNDGSRITISGVCTVELNNHLISRNEVYFDRLGWIEP